MIQRNHYAPKPIMCIFLKSAGPALLHQVESGQTIDHEYYIENCLQLVIDEIKKRRPSLGTRALKTHHDNGKLHINKAVSNYLRAEGVTIIPRPPNSSVLAPCNLWSFDFIKQNTGDQNDSESLFDAVTKFMNSLDKEEYRKTFDKWIQRMGLCVDNEGDYFKHLMK
jgi:hypothetical protein